MTSSDEVLVFVHAIQGKLACKYGACRKPEDTAAIAFATAMEVVKLFRKEQQREL